MYKADFHKYDVSISKDALLDIRSIKRYILDTFQYREYAESFSREIKKAIQELDTFPAAYVKTGYTVEEYEVFLKPYHTYLIFYVIEGYTVTVIRVLKDKMYWQSIIESTQKINR